MMEQVPLRVGGTLFLVPSGGVGRKLTTLAFSPHLRGKSAEFRHFPGKIQGALHFYAPSIAVSRLSSKHGECWSDQISSRGRCFSTLKMESANTTAVKENWAKEETVKAENVKETATSAEAKDEAAVNATTTKSEAVHKYPEKATVVKEGTSSSQVVFERSASASSTEAALSSERNDGLSSNIAGKQNYSTKEAAEEKQKYEKIVEDAASAATHSLQNNQSNEKTVSSPEVSAVKGDDGSQLAPESATSTEDGNGSHTKRLWTKWRIFGLLLATSGGAGMAYLLYLNDFDVGKTEWMISKQISRWIKGSPPLPESHRNTEFNAALESETLEELATYFLQYDIDKVNGIRRSDVVDFLEEAGISRENEICTRFLYAGPGRDMDRKKFSGCSMQEFAEVLEELTLEEKIVNKFGKGFASTAARPWFWQPGWWQARVNAKQRKTVLAAAREGNELAGTSEIEQRVLAKLRELNAAVTPENKARASLLQPSFQKLANLRKGIEDVVEEEEVNPLEIRQLELERVEKLAGALHTLKEAKGLSIAEEERLATLMENLKVLQEEIRDLKMMSK